MELIKKIGQFVKNQRLQKGMSQTILSEKIFGYADQPFVSDLENGNTKAITTSTLDKILEALDAEIEFKGLN